MGMAATISAVVILTITTTATLTTATMLTMAKEGKVRLSYPGVRVGR
jgi:hypothetical protein